MRTIRVHHLLGNTLTTMSELQDVFENKSIRPFTEITILNDNEEVVDLTTMSFEECEQLYAKLLNAITKHKLLAELVVLKKKLDKREIDYKHLL